MIQRVQSMYLAAVLILGILVTFWNPTYAKFENIEKQLVVQVGYTKTIDLQKDGDKASGHRVSKFLNYILLISISVGSGLAIFLYKKTALQKKVCIYLTLLSAVLVLLMILEYVEQNKQMTYGTLGFWAIFPLVFMTCTALAWNSIRRDENLLKSMDRIR
jgi:hypothetical protein